MMGYNEDISKIITQALSKSLQYIYILFLMNFMNTESLSPIEESFPHPISRKELQQKIKAEKARQKMQRKAQFRKKAEKKLEEKAERKAFHKKENAQKKFEAKMKNKRHAR